MFFTRYHPAIFVLLSVACLACSSTTSTTTSPPEQPTPQMPSTSFTSWADKLSIAATQIKSVTPVTLDDSTIAHVVSYTSQSKEKQVWVPHDDFASGWKQIAGDEIWFAPIVELHIPVEKTLSVPMTRHKKGNFDSHNKKRPGIILISEVTTPQPDTEQLKYSQSSRHTGVQKNTFIHFLEPAVANPRWVQIKQKTKNADGYGGFELHTLRIKSTPKGLYLHAQKQLSHPFNKSRSPKPKPTEFTQKLFPSP